MKILKIIIFFSIICFISACESETGAIENQFKNEAQNLIRILNKMQKIQSKKKVVKFSDNIEASYNNNEGRKLFIEENKEALSSINKNLSRFTKDYRNSKWADDAAFCRALAYIFVYGPNRDIFNIEDNLVKEFLDSYNEIQLENWTKKELDKYYELFLEGVPSDLLSELSESEIIENGLYHFLISELSSSGEYQKAQLIIKEIEAKGANEYIIKSLKDLVAQYKSMENVLKSGN